MHNYDIIIAVITVIILLLFLVLLVIFSILINDNLENKPLVGFLIFVVFIGLSIISYITKLKSENLVKYIFRRQILEDEITNLEKIISERPDNIYFNNLLEIKKLQKKVKT